MEEQKRGCEEISIVVGRLRAARTAEEKIRDKEI